MDKNKSRKLALSRVRSAADEHDGRRLATKHASFKVTVATPDPDPQPLSDGPDEEDKFLQKNWRSLMEEADMDSDEAAFEAKRRLMKKQAAKKKSDDAGYDPAGR